MHPFDHPSSTQTLSGNDMPQWADSIDHNYLAICDGKTVLDIACGNGDISKRILKHHPKSLTMIDPGVEQSPVQENNTVKFVSEDVNLWLCDSRPVEVVVCFGLFYHLHNSLHLLELIVNNCDPEILILDNVVAPHPLAFNKEPFNIPGSRQINKEWIACPFNLVTPFFIFNESLSYMGYDLVKSHHLKFEDSSKSNSWVAEWKKKVNQI